MSSSNLSNTVKIRLKCSDVGSKRTSCGDPPHINMSSTMLGIKLMVAHLYTAFSSQHLFITSKSRIRRRPLNATEEVRETTEH